MAQLSPKKSPRNPPLSAIMNTSSYSGVNLMLIATINIFPHPKIGYKKQAINFQIALENTVCALFAPIMVKWA
jgi:hypothetical protein